MSSDSKSRSDGVEEITIEEQFLLRVPQSMVKVMDKVIDMHKDAPELNIRMDTDRKGTLELGGHVYRVTLVDMPCYMETHKTLDLSVYYKSADVHQMFLVESDLPEDAIPEKQQVKYDDKYQLDSGLTKPTRHIRTERWRRRVEFDVSSVQAMINRIKAYAKSKEQHKDTYELVEIQEAPPPVPPQQPPSSLSTHTSASSTMPAPKVASADHSMDIDLVEEPKKSIVPKTPKLSIKSTPQGLPAETTKHAAPPPKPTEPEPVTVKQEPTTSSTVSEAPAPASKPAMKFKFSLKPSPPAAVATPTPTSTTPLPAPLSLPQSFTSSTLSPAPVVITQPSSSMMDSDRIAVQAGPPSTVPTSLIPSNVPSYLGTTTPGSISSPSIPSGSYLPSTTSPADLQYAPVESASSSAPSVTATSGAEKVKKRSELVNKKEESLKQLRTLESKFVTESNPILKRRIQGQVLDLQKIVKNLETEIAAIDQELHALGL